ncbi:MAG TPA: hypothetical protein VLC92_19425 [Rhodocyclaceae bacterium]|nr:hypothetical protein [Rhodocyclaceae bacterium]
MQKFESENKLTALEAANDACAYPELTPQESAGFLCEPVRNRNHAPLLQTPSARSGDVPHADPPSI